ncbi:hypothetical protein M422DRAFT_48160 [Sphaerobolus stellatus SS14]|uniref:Unplaced genomic scaffold SPHSTscaffold_54, whole genome shotgun sequence n=1 Tax=Sphaerobolus stellatus (strain SS14) TaxID=990650 RepID=A0A0C9VW29_SPHS4|nr:hypothetical protein M422DRAFT_48160 [Sphaerobolus stellatus SS14]
MKFRYCTTLSKEVPLELYIHLKGYLDPSTQRMLIETMQRCVRHIERLFIHLGDSRHIHTFGQIMKVFGGDSPVTALQELRIRSTKVIPESLLPHLQFPNLKCLNIDWESHRIIAALSVDTLKSVKTCRMEYPRGTYTQPLDDSQAIEKLPNLDRLLISLQSLDIFSGRICASPVSLKFLSLKVWRSSVVANFILNLSLPLLEHFTLQYDSYRAFISHIFDIFSLDETFQALSDIQTGNIKHFTFIGLQIESAFLKGPFKKFKDHVKLEFVRCGITEGVLKTLTSYAQLRYLRICNSNLSLDDLRHLLEDRVKGDSVEEEQLQIVEVKVVCAVPESVRSALLSLQKKYPHIIYL